MEKHSEFLDRLMLLGISKSFDIIGATGYTRPRRVYHYTNAAGLHGILGSGRPTFWANHFDSMNDPTESRFLYRLAQSAFEGALKSSPMDENAGLETLDHFKGAMMTLMLERETTPALYQHHRTPYIVSLSAAQDDLSQWRSYAGDGLGFCVGLDQKRLYDFMLETVEGQFKLWPVVYDLEAQRLLVMEVFETVLGELFRECERHGRDEQTDGELMAEASVGLWGLFSLLSPVMKHKAYASEHEWRLVLDGPEGDDRSGFRTRVSGNTMISYAQIELPAELVVEVWCGPRQPPEAAEAVGEFLRSVGLPHVRVLRSDIPYRRPP